jgi:hypothetical protein
MSEGAMKRHRPGRESFIGASPYACLGKHRYESRALAQEVCARMRRRHDRGRFNVYRCRVCGGFHIGSNAFVRDTSVRKRNRWMDMGMEAAEGEETGHVDDDEPFCYTCISSGYWNDCEECGGEGYHEDEDWDGWMDHITCDICHGKGGWWRCLGSAHHDLMPGSIHGIPLGLRGKVAEQ